MNCICRVTYHSDKLEKAQSYGFETISDCVYVMYEEDFLSTTQIAKLLDVSPCTGNRWCGIVTTPRGRGGFHDPNSPNINLNKYK